MVHPLRTTSSMKDAPAASRRLLAALAAAAVAVGPASGQDREVPETFTATTANMDPDGEDVRFSLLRWSSDADRRAVLDVLTGADDEPAAADGGADEEGESDESAALLELPTVGYLWPGSSGVGYSLKFAHRAAAPDGGEHLTFVTGRRLGTFGRAPWAPPDAPEAAPRRYTVIELRLDSSGAGAGATSAAADVAFDAENALVALRDYDAAPVLFENVRRRPPPYWAR